MPLALLLATVVAADTSVDLEQEDWARPTVQGQTAAIQVTMAGLGALASSCGLMFTGMALGQNTTHVPLGHAPALYAVTGGIAGGLVATRLYYAARGHHTWASAVIGPLLGLGLASFLIAFVGEPPARAAMSPFTTMLPIFSSAVVDWLLYGAV